MCKYKYHKAANPEPKHATDILAVTQSLLVITGAGISAESGLPTFRGLSGILAKDPDLQRVLSAEGLRQDPRAVWDFINQFRIRAAAAQPNAAHHVLAQWEQANRFPAFLIATQNIDGLHQAAGNQRVSELHGSVWQFASPRQTDYTEDDNFSADFQDFLFGHNRESLLRKQQNPAKIILRRFFKILNPLPIHHFPTPSPPLAASFCAK